MSLSRFGGDASLDGGSRSAQLLARVPEAEHAHWFDHWIAAPVSVNYLQMTTITAACIDDGDTEPWE